MTRRILLLAAVAALVLVAPAGRAGAHEGDGTIEVLAADPAGPLQVSYRVRLTFQADGHPAVDATVTVVAEGPDGTTTTPQPMAPAGEDGVYAATVLFPAPGAWTVRFTAVTPAATAERAETVAPPPTTTSTSTTTTTVSTTTTVGAAADDPENDGDSDPPVVPLVAGAVAVAAVAGVLVARRRR